ncbi:hypothetical protein PLEOSDRAFT_1081780 [Pleurotus ostreatus PC15]|uniref:Uncharacterized protein n=1 Tax=Pleurotus ostreatus (strain PC15) TaxID=1137138 RepID=A0A067P1G7_PLEO1|nr:hypothetical protein PLEOSDRAFT_1081780 [Pleurotus ostreatus PC15]
MLNGPSPTSSASSVPVPARLNQRGPSDDMDIADISDRDQSRLSVSHTQQHLTVTATTWHRNHALEHRWKVLILEPMALVTAAPQDDDDTEMDSEPGSANSSPRKRHKLVSGVDTGGVSTTRTVTRIVEKGRERPPHRQQQQEVSKRRLKKKETVLNMTSAQLAEREAELRSQEQLILGKEEMLERLYAQSQQHELETREFAAQILQERMLYQNELASKEDEVQTLRREQANLQANLQRLGLREASAEPVVIISKDAEEEIEKLKGYIVVS